MAKGRNETIIGIQVTPKTFHAINSICKLYGTNRSREGKKLFVEWAESAGKDLMEMAKQDAQRGHDITDRDQDLSAIAMFLEEVKQERRNHRE